MTCREALGHVAKIIHILHDEAKDKPFELEMSWVCEATKWKHDLVPAELVKEANEWAKASIEADEMDDGDD
jgi:20S proteasome subunit alpha 7